MDLRPCLHGLRTGLLRFSWWVKRFHPELVAACELFRPVSRRIAILGLEATLGSGPESASRLDATPRSGITIRIGYFTQGFVTNPSKPARRTVSSKKRVERATLPPLELADTRLVAAMDHPYRVHIMGVLSQRVASPAEIAKELGVETNALMHHFRKLLDLGVIELVRVAETEGGRLLGHYYRAIARGWVEADEWKRVSPADQPAITAMILANCNADLRAAVAAGTIHGDENVIARVPVAVDTTGEKELVDLLNETTREVLHIAERSAARMGSPNSELKAVKVHIIHFESPSPASSDTSV